MNASKSAGESPTGVAPVASTFAFRSGWFITFTISALSLFTISGDVPAGTTIPHVCVIS